LDVYLLFLLGLSLRLRPRLGLGDLGLGLDLLLGLSLLDLRLLGVALRVPVAAPGATTLLVLAAGTFKNKLGKY
jgi:hypothetical protein